MTTITSLAAIAQSNGEGLTFNQVLSSLPSDPASIATTVLLAGSLALVLWFGRPRGGKGGRPA